MALCQQDSPYFKHHLRNHRDDLAPYSAACYHMGEAVWHVNRAIEDLVDQDRTGWAQSLLRTMQGMLYYAEEMFMDNAIKSREHV